MMWGTYASEKSVGDMGYDLGEILRVEEHPEGAVITLENHRHLMDYEIVGGNENWEPDEEATRVTKAFMQSIQSKYSHSVCIIIYRTLLHSAWFNNQGEAEAAYEAIKKEVQDLFDWWDGSVSVEEVSDWCVKFADRYS